MSYSRALYSCQFVIRNEPQSYPFLQHSRVNCTGTDMTCLHNRIHCTPLEAGGVPILRSTAIQVPTVRSVNSLTGAPLSPGVAYPIEGSRASDNYKYSSVAPS